jgi:hypothetical protein
MGRNGRDIARGTAGMEAVGEPSRARRNRENVCGILNGSSPKVKKW